MARIFLSYAKLDEPFVAELANRLTKAGHDPVFSGGTLTAGQPWRTTLTDQLRDADCVLIVLSQRSAESEWVMTEVGAALGYFHERGRPFVLPLVIDDIPIPVQLSHIQALIAHGRSQDEVVAEISRSIAAMTGRLQARKDDAAEAHARVELNAAQYIAASLLELRHKEKTYRVIAYSWYTASLVALLGGVAFGLYRASLPATADPDWHSIAHLAVASLLVVGLVSALSRFAFVLGKSFMVESLRNADRIHAISFGQFYLEAFGEKAEWSEIKEAFQHWNIDSGSSFIKQSTADIDPQIIKAAIEVAKGLGGKAKEKH